MPISNNEKHPNIHELHQRLGTDRQTGKTYAQKHHKRQTHPLSGKPVIYIVPQKTPGEGDQLIFSNF